MRRTFIERLTTRLRTQQEFDLAILWKQWNIIEKGTQRPVRKNLDTYAQSGGSADRLVSVKMSSHFGQTLVHAAARFCRIKCLRLLRRNIPCFSRHRGREWFYTPLSSCLVERQRTGSGLPCAKGGACRRCGSAAADKFLRRQRTIHRANMGV